METKNTWFTADNILPEHKDLPVRQVYVWFVTSDHQIVIVGRNDKFQFPGGKPEEGESISDTMDRELYEEAGLQLNEYPEKPVFFGYYLLEGDVNPRWDGSPYLQLRYLLQTTITSDKIELSVNERIDDTDQLEVARFVPLDHLSQYIPWVDGLEEHDVVLGLTKS